MVEMVKSTGEVTVARDESWRWGKHDSDDGVVTVTIAPELFNPSDTGKRDKYLTGVGDTATVVYIRSGLPLAKITSGGNTGLYGPYDSTADDGRQTKIAGLLESQVEMKVTLGGMVLDDPAVGMRYRGDIVVDNLPIETTGATWGGDFWDVEDDTVTYLSTGSPVSLDEE